MQTNIENAVQGRLFTNDFLLEGVTDLDEWKTLNDQSVDEIEISLLDIFDNFPITQTPNETHTEDDLIWPVLERLGWTEKLRHQNLSERGMDDVPDGILFGDKLTKRRATAMSERPERYELGVLMVESKRWLRPLDRASGSRSESVTPSTQMLRYLRRAEDLTIGKMRWGLLTNGMQWRLYYQGARSVAEQFFEINLATVLNLSGHNDGLFPLSEDQRHHCLKLFILFFGKISFLNKTSDGRTLHQLAIDEGRFYEERVASNLSQLVFENVFPTLVKAISSGAPDAKLDEVRNAALVLLYRLLFIFYAEDRGLLPVHDGRYNDNIGLRKNVRENILLRIEKNEVFSEKITGYWNTISDLCRVIDKGEVEFGLPPYNGGLFDDQRTPLLKRITLSNSTVAHVIKDLSFEFIEKKHRYINYRDLSVQQLGSIYERLLEHEVIRDNNEIIVRPNIYARKCSGSYYTPDSLVSLILQETVGRLVDERLEAFRNQVDKIQKSDVSSEQAISELKIVDPAEQMLTIKVCDPAMGSGHFLVSLVDYLSDHVIAAIAEANNAVPDYVSPLIGQIETIRERILDNAKHKWSVKQELLDDRHIVRRMILKRCIYGVDKNPMAVELAKVSLWLHTFTVGAPLSFLDHHLRTGDSLFGYWIQDAIKKTEKKAGPLLFPRDDLEEAQTAANPMKSIEKLTDADLAEARESIDLFTKVDEQTKPLNAFMSLLYALEWLDPQDIEETAVASYLTGMFGDVVDIAQDAGAIIADSKLAKLAKLFSSVLENANDVVNQERFLHWQVAFPGVWPDWENGNQGGFDVVVGNPPWDKMKLQQVEWFKARDRDVALQQRASDRKKMIEALVRSNSPLAKDYEYAYVRALSALRMARNCGNYPKLSKGDVNLYSLFIERSLSLIKQGGLIGLLTPSGIYADKTASEFFKEISTKGRIASLFDFENRRLGTKLPPFFPDVHPSFKFCAIIVGGDERTFKQTRCSFFLKDLNEINDPERCFSLSSDDFSRVNPNTGTAPVFRLRRDADITRRIYEHHPVLVDRSGDKERRTWPVRYKRMFDMTNDSHLFRTESQLNKTEGFFRVDNKRWKGKKRGQRTEYLYLPLYEGKMVQAFDHRAASIKVNLDNMNRPAQPVSATLEQHQNPDWLPDPQYWVRETEITLPQGLEWFVAFKDVTATTNVRTMIAAIVPRLPFGNTLPILIPETDEKINDYRGNIWLLAACFNSVMFDFVARQKVQGQHLNWFIVEQLPVIQLFAYNNTTFGSKTATEIIRETILELTYTAHDMEPFARDLGHVDESGKVKPPFSWNEDRRLRLRAKLDAIFFNLYGVTDEKDIKYIYSTFHTMKREEEKKYNKQYRSRDLCLAYMKTLAAGMPDENL